MTVPDRGGVWRTSAYSKEGQDCVEVKLSRVVGVRDTKDRRGGELAVTGAAWRALLEDVARD